MEKETFLKLYEMFNKLLEEKDTYDTATASKNVTNLTDYYSIAKKEKNIQLTADLLLIANIKNKLSAYKTITIFKTGEIKMSKESVKQVLKNNFLKLGISYDDFKEAVETLYAHKMYKIPYVYHNLFLIQINGRNKDDVIWINASNVVSYEQQNNQLNLGFINGYYYLANTTEDSFEKQIEKVAKLYLLQKEYLNDLALKIKTVHKRSVLTKILPHIQCTSDEIVQFNFHLQYKKMQTRDKINQNE